MTQTIGNNLYNNLQDQTSNNKDLSKNKSRNNLSASVNFNSATLGVGIDDNDDDVVVRLYNLKAKNGQSDKSFPKLLKLLGDGMRRYILATIIVFSIKRSEKIRNVVLYVGSQVPIGYSSNIKSLMQMKDLELIILKSHDCHTLMQQLLQVALFVEFYQKMVITMINSYSYLNPNKPPRNTEIDIIMISHTHLSGVTRRDQDQVVVESHRRSGAATTSGKFIDEIIHVSTKPVIVSVNDGIRPNANLSDLTKLKPAFKKDGSTTAGNASQVNDGARVVLLMKRGVAMQKGLPILGVFRSFDVVGVDPAIMGIGPTVAIPATVKSAGLELGDIDLFLINEVKSFAYQFVYCLKKLKLDPKKVNINGGAIFLGHPLGATGAHCIATLLNEMKHQGKDYCFGVISMCIGGRVERCSSSHLCEQTGYCCSL
ncbi:hypothetical protein UlMin_013787 [Ulmus minor]